MAGKNTITRRIALEGGADLEAQLKRLGKAGEDAFKHIQQAAAQVKGPGADFAARTAALSKSLKQTGEGMLTLGKNARKLGTDLSILGAAVVGLGIGFGALVKHGADAADQMEKNAEKAGLTIDAYSKLQFAAEQNDVSAEQLGGAMKILSGNLADAAGGSAKAAGLFKQLGVNIKGSNGELRPTEEIFRDLVAGFSKMEDGAKKTALAVDIFGRSGQELIPLLNATGKGIDELYAQVVQLGLGFTKQEATIGDTFGDSLNLMTRSITALADHIGLVFAPALTAVTDAVTQFIADNREAIIGFFQGIVDTISGLPSGVKTALAVIGTVAAGLIIVLGPLVLAFGLLASGIGAAFIAIGGLVSGIGALGLGIAEFIGSLAGLGPAIVAVVGFIGGWGFAIAAIVVAIGILAYEVITHWDEIKEAFKKGAAAVAKYIGDIIGKAAAAAEAITKPFVDAFDTLWNKAKSVFADILAWLGQVIGKAAAAAQAITGVGGGRAQGGPAVARARGGPVHGAGTSTSDSIPAWLSAGEFVVKTKAVQHYGADFMHAINGMRLAGGGMVAGFTSVLPSTKSMSTPAVLSSAGPKSVLNLYIGEEEFAGMLVPDRTAQSLSRYASQRKLSRIGKQPGWSQ